MKSLSRFRMFSLFLVMAYLLAACGGTLPQAATSAKGPKAEANTIVSFTGVVESVNGTEWTISGQEVTLDPQASLDPNIRVGDDVKVEAGIATNGTVVALKIESSKNDDTVSTPSADSTSDGSESRPQSSDINGNEVFGAVEALTADTITVNGVTYDLTNSTEIKDMLAVGDQVKLHVTINADGTVAVREIEKSVASLDNNSNPGGSDDGPNHDANDNHSKGNGSDDGPNHDSNDDHGGNSGSGGSND